MTTSLAVAHDTISRARIWFYWFIISVPYSAMYENFISPSDGYCLPTLSLINKIMNWILNIHIMLIISLVVYVHIKIVYFWFPLDYSILHHSRSVGQSMASYKGNSQGWDKTFCKRLTQNLLLRFVIYFRAVRCLAFPWLWEIGPTLHYIIPQY